jgi:hypothetical protein
LEDVFHRKNTVRDAILLLPISVEVSPLSDELATATPHRNYRVDGSKNSIGGWIEQDKTSGVPSLRFRFLTPFSKKVGAAQGIRKLERNNSPRNLERKHRKEGGSGPHVSSVDR